MWWYTGEEIIKLELKNNPHKKNSHFVLFSQPSNDGTLSINRANMFLSPAQQNGPQFKSVNIDVVRITYTKNDTSTFKNKSSLCVKTNIICTASIYFCFHYSLKRNVFLIKCYCKTTFR